MIPEDALFAVLDNQHEELKAWKEAQVQLVSKSTFSNAERFPDYKLNYDGKSADLSLLDCDKAQMKSKPNNAHGWTGATKREWLFLNKEQVEIVQDVIRKKDLTAKNLSLARERAEDANQQQLKQKHAGQMGG